MARDRPSDRWRGRPFLSALVRAAVFWVPIMCSVGASMLLVRFLPPAEGTLQLAAWWILSIGASTVVLLAVARLARRAMPLAVLLRLSLAFPGEVPSRWRIARRAANVRDLEEKVRRARSAGVDDEPTRAAEHILGLVAAVEAHDKATRGHSERVRIYTDLLAEELSLPPDARDRLRWAAMLHDVGKLEVPAKVLNKPSKPTPREWELIKSHPDEGARLIAPLASWLGAWAAAVREHHERYDGDGYPGGCAGATISLGGRMLAVTDSFETMTAMRAYKRPMSPAKARAELVACAGSHFDPTIVRAFLRISVRKLSLISGPLSWLAQTPVLRSLEIAATNAARAASTGLAAGGTALALTVGPATVVKDEPPIRRAAANARDVHAATDGTVDEVLEPSPTPSVEPTPLPTPKLSDEPTVEPSREPTPGPSDDPTIEPSDDPATDPGVPPLDPKEDPSSGPGIDGSSFDELRRADRLK